MLKKLIVLLLITFFFAQALYPAFDYKNLSAASAGLAGIKTLSDDEAIAVLYNPVLIGDSKNKEFDFFYTKFYDIDELPINAAAFSLPFLRGHLGFAYSGFGKSDFYQEQTIAAAYKFNISKNVSLGLKLQKFEPELRRDELSDEFVCYRFCWENKLQQKN